MKKLLLLSFLFFVGFCSYAQFQDTMEYEPGDQIGIWWGCAPPPSPYCLGINTDQAHSGLRSGLIPDDGSTDVILDLGNQIFSVWSLSFWMYIPSNNEAYWNLQGQLPVGAGEWIVGNIFFNQDNANPGVGLIDDCYFGQVEFDFPHDQWFSVTMSWDITSGIALATWEMYVDQVEVLPAGTPFTNSSGTVPTSLGGIDFFSISTDNILYLDDFCYQEFFEPCYVFGIEDNDLKSINVYPNPVQDLLYIENKSITTINNIKIYDVLGRLVISEKGNVDQMDVSHLNSGVLFMEIESELGIVTKKLIKE